jgi:RNA-directed DNA polymerase
MKTLQDLASVLNVTESVLKQLAETAPLKYQESKIKKKTGGFRVIEAPHPELKRVQRKLLDSVLHPLDCHPILFGGPNSSTRKAAIPHRHQPLVMALDIKTFFPSVTAKQVSHALLRLGFSSEVSIVITRLVTRNRRLPQGAPTSPAMARLALHPLCEEIQKLLRKIHHETRVSVYVDDLTISGPAGLIRLRGTIVKMFKRHGFVINPEKIRSMKQNVPQEVLGISVNGNLKPGTEFSAKLAAARKQLPADDLSLKGMEAYARSVIG